jgi:heterotetrameric sarcosine oxidase gamma subunit
MSGTSVSGGAPFVSDEVQAAPLLEVVALASARWPADWPVAPGSVQRDGAGSAVVLHFAPGRWLAVAAALGVAPLVDAACRRGDCTVSDVSGKWHRVRAVGAAAARGLASSIDTEVVLDDRACAATTLFDCPVIIVRDATGFSIWIRSSYQAAFFAAVERALKPR